MSYSPIYQFTFDSLNGQTYTGYIDKKNYTGTVSNVRCAGEPVQQQWQQDDAAPAVKGCNLTVTLINDTTLPITSFFSVNDDEYRIRYFWDTQLLFIGYLVQDDSSEIQIDIPHDITLNFTDNLGLLKDIPFDQGNRLVGTKTQFVGDFSVTADLYLILFNTVTSGAQIGDNVTVESGTLADGLYTIVNITILGPHTFLYFSEPIPFNVTPGTIGTFTFIQSADLTTRLPLKTFIKICLLNTNLELDCSVFNNLVVDGGSTGRMFEDVYLLGETFLSGENWQSCYQVLEIIMNRYKCSVFQSYGIWNIVRWDELRYNDNDIPSLGYDSNMNYVGNGGTIQLFNYGDGTDIETGLLGTALRAWQFDKETFNYKQPKNILRNANLQNLGALVNSFIDGANTVYDYEFTDWSAGPFVPPTLIRRIRVTRTTIGNIEVSRVAYCMGITGDDARSNQSYPIEANEGDSCVFGFDFKTSESQPGPNSILIGIRVYDGTNNWYLQNDGKWSSSLSPGYIYAMGSGTNTNEWQSVTVNANFFPANGLLYVYLCHPHSSPDAGNITYYRNISFQYFFTINESTQIIGHIHNDSQSGFDSTSIKNNEDEEIFIDDSPRNSINGTTFLSSFTGVLQNRTLFWNRAGITEAVRVGEIITFERLFHRRKTRLKLEGNLLGLVQPGVFRYTGDCEFGALDPDSGLPVIYFPFIPPGYLVAGATFTITGSASNDGTYTAIAVSTAYPDNSVTVAGPLTVDFADNATITFDNIPVHLSLLNVLKYAPLPAKNFIFGMLNIKFKPDQANGTFYEQWEDGEVDSDLLEYYYFKYLYDTR